jgi:threonine dehydrogenase-like Zn-dependent dehydrogenase
MDYGLWIVKLHSSDRFFRSFFSSPTRGFSPLSLRSQKPTHSRELRFSPDVLCHTFPLPEVRDSDGLDSASSENTKMKACVLYDVGRMEVREISRPEVSPHQVLVRISAVGICGTDAHIFAGHANYNIDEAGQKIPLSRQPQILGHEISGRIEEMGSRVGGLRPGDRVLVDQGLNCLSAGRTELCEYCLSGDSHQCEFYREHGITGLPGGLAEFMAVPASNVIVVPSVVDMAEAALVEPVGCVLHASNTVAHAHTRYKLQHATPDRRVRGILICGGGPAGLLFVQYLRRVLGYDGLLLVSEPNETKRKLAKRLGADETLDPHNINLGEAVRDRTAGRGVEYLIEASGQGQVFATIPTLIRKQATVLLYGHGHAGVDLSVLNGVMFKEPILITPVGASGGFETDGKPSVYTRALRLIEDREMEVAPFITHRFLSLDDVQSALSAGMHRPDYVKGVVVLKPS